MNVTDKGWQAYFISGGRSSRSQLEKQAQRFHVVICAPEELSGRDSGAEEAASKRKGRSKGHGRYEPQQGSICHFRHRREDTSELLRGLTWEVHDQFNYTNVQELHLRVPGNVL